MTISSSVGLISGINYDDIITKLLAIDARPRTLIQNRNTVLQSQAAAFQAINAKLLSLKLSAGALTKSAAFQPTTATSSDENVLSVTSGPTATPGTYDFRVHRLVSSQQTITRGFADTDASFVAPGGATLTFEPAAARLDAETTLGQLNGGDGVTRGYVRITDRSGASALIDLSAVYTVQDVLDKINSNTGINVTASVSADGFVLTDNTGQITSNLIVQNVGSSATGTSLGLAASVAAASITGTTINYIGANSLLSNLNDGNGVQNVSGVADFRITLRDGTNVDIDLDSIVTVAQLIAEIDTAGAGSVTAAVDASGAALELTDNTAGATTFAVTALNSSNAATDLGILTTDGDADGVITGQRLIAGINSKLVRNLNGGNGVTLGTISITNRAGASTSVDLSAVESISELIDAINDAGAGVTASLNSAGNGLLITDNTGSTASDLVISDVSGTAAADLNLAGTYSADSVNSDSLQYRYITLSSRIDTLGVTRGKFIITDSNGVSGTVDLTQGNEVTIADVISEINSRGLAINARVNDNGDGIVIEDTGAGVVALKVEENGSTTARDLGILGEAANPGDDLDGSFQKTVTVAATDTLTDVVNAIKDADVGVSAAIINDGSAGVPYRLSLSSERSGKSAGFIFDDGGLDLGANTLTQASDALVFFGASNPAASVAITSNSNTLSSVIPGATLSLHSTSDTNVRIAVAKDEDTIVASVSDLVTKFNDIITTLDSYDKYDAETEQRGLLLGDPTTANVRSSLFRVVISRNNDLTSQYNALSQIGITVGTGGTSISFDETKFRAALQSNPDAVEQLFTYKVEDDDDNITASGIGVAIDQLLDRLTDSEDGQLQTRLDAIDSQIQINTKRIDALTVSLAAKRQRYLSQFVAMEKALAILQGQSQALAGFSSVSSSSSSSSSG